VDTAGLRDSDDVIEIEGVRRSRQQIERADLVLWLSPADAPDLPGFQSVGDMVVIHSKADLVDSAPEQRSVMSVSALDAESLGSLLAMIEDRARSSLGSGDAIVTRQRQRVLLLQVVEHLERSVPNLEGGLMELAAEDVRLALRCLGQISGRVDVDDVLDRIFGAFCIGK
jgi:tRNA modification GTPase